MSSVHRKAPDSPFPGTGGLFLDERPIFELSRSGRRAASLPTDDLPEEARHRIPEDLIRADIPEFPEVSEPELVRHFTRLSQWNFSIDHGFYPLGSCTMKYNPKVNEVAAAIPGFLHTHPEQPAETVQGPLELMADLQDWLAEISGFAAVSLQPAAGAHGELAGMLIIRAYHDARGDDQRRVVLIPDSAHGTNPASATLCGYESVEVRSDERGMVDLDDLKAKLDHRVAALMLTNPNTLGVFEEDVCQISQLVHQAGGLVYGDGANLNAVVGRALPAQMGIDVLHFNLHKTFSTPHGGGGPGSGPVGVTEALEPFLPIPVIRRETDRIRLDWDRPQSIGKISTFYGNFSIMVRAASYILSLGAPGLELVSGAAVLNASYLRKLLDDRFHLPYGTATKHEVVFSDKHQKARGVTTMDMAKRLLDYGFHAPTVYFPLIVPGALMMEPTESESRETLDLFAQALREIDRESREEPELVTGAPHRTKVSRMDETRAARNPRLRWSPLE